MSFSIIYFLGKTIEIKLSSILPLCLTKSTLFFEGVVSYLRPLKRQIPLGCKAICNERDYKEDPSGVWSKMWDSCHFTSDVIMCILIIAVMEINPPQQFLFSQHFCQEFLASPKIRTWLQSLLEDNYTVFSIVIYPISCLSKKNYVLIISILEWYYHIVILVFIVNITFSHDDDLYVSFFYLCILVPMQSNSLL